IQGTWLVTALEREGQAVSKAELARLHFKLIFSGDKVTFDYTGGTEVGTFKLEAGNNAKTIEVIKELDTSKGIYRLEGDSLKICGVPSGEEPPAEFASKPGTKQVLFVLQRQKLKSQP